MSKPLYQMTPPATHMRLLFACLEATKGPVLEFGVGTWSTSLTSAFAMGDRFVRSVESNKSWFDLVCPLCTRSDGLWRKEHGGTHEILHVKSYDDVVIDDHDWEIVFLDQEPPDRRGVDALRLRDGCRLMILHDSWQVEYKTDGVFHTFKHCLTDFRWPPSTTVGSDEPLDWLKELIPSLSNNRGPLAA